ncbi:MAG: nucleoside monophosphate kinase [Patescibacteria group bacterium]
MRASKIALILLGRPGSGKDTQAELLAKKFGLVHIISSKLIEKALSSSKKSVKFEGKIYDVQKERKHIHSGALVNFNFVAALINNEIKKVSRQGDGLIMSASPRNLIELKKEIPLLKKLFGRDNICFFHVVISPKEVYIRNLKRRRKDLPELDTRKIIKKRLETFNRYTWPAIKLLKKQKRIIDINGEQKIMKIHRDILKILLSELKLK